MKLQPSATQNKQSESHSGSGRLLPGWGLVIFDQSLKKPFRNAQKSTAPSNLPAGIGVSDFLAPLPVINNHSLK